MANEFIARRGLKVLDNGINVTGSGVFSSHISASGNITASAFYGDGANVTGVISSSFTTTSSLAINNIITASAAGNVITFTKGDASTFAVSITTDQAATASYVEFADVVNKPTLVSASSQIDHNQTTNYVANEHIDHSTVNITAGDGLLGGGDITATRTLSLSTSSAHFTNGVKEKLNADNIVSSSAQIDVRNTTGIATIATTGSNTFTGVQTISDTTNSTTFNNGALIVAGGVGIAKDVNISGSLNITGLLTVTSMSTQYVTSSEFTVGTSRITLNDDDLVRFAGVTIIDSGSTAASGSILWDSLNNHFIYETDDIHNGTVDIHSAIIVAGPETYSDLGNEIGLIEGRVPIATSDHNIDNRPESSSIRIIPGTLETHIEAGLYVTGAITSSVGFSGDGSNLTGIVTTLAITASDNSTATINLKNQGLIVSGTNGLVAQASGQTLTISGSDATTTTKGVASFNTNNFTVVGGAVTAKNAIVNGVNVVLGSSVNISLAEITSASALTPDQLLLEGGAIIHGVLHTSGSAVIPSPLNSVVVSIPTGSYDAAHFDYVLKSGANLRTGTVMSIWQAGTSNIEFTDTSTSDLGDTLSEIFTTDLLNGNVRLKLTGDSSTWTVRTAIRMI